MDALLETIGRVDGRALVFLGFCVAVWAALIWFSWRAEKGLGRVGVLVVIGAVPTTFTLICYDMRIRSDLNNMRSETSALRASHQIQDRLYEVRANQPRLVSYAEDITNRYLVELVDLASGTRLLRDEDEYFRALTDELALCERDDRVFDVVQPFNPQRPTGNAALKLYMQRIDEATRRGVHYELYLRANNEVSAQSVEESAQRFTAIGANVHLLGEIASDRSRTNVCLFERKSGASACAPQRRNDAWITGGRWTINASLIERWRDDLRYLEQRIDKTLKAVQRPSSDRGPPEEDK